jgi:hypothetical protein
MILVENGGIFEGTREQFTNCFFSNATDSEILDWCRLQSFSLSINGEELLKSA